MQRFSRTVFSALGLVLFANGCGEGGVGEVGGRRDGNSVAILGPIAFAEQQTIPYRGMSATQLDTLCVDFTRRDLNAVQATLDEHAETAGSAYPEVLQWYREYRLNDQDYVTHCLSGGFPKTFTSLRTGATHTVTNLDACRAVTSNLAATEYVDYIRGGGAPVMIAGKLKSSGCGGSVAPYLGRIQSIHGSFIDDYRAIPQSYP